MKNWNKIPIRKWKYVIQNEIYGIRLQLENGNENPSRKWKSNLKMKVKEHLKIREWSKLVKITKSEK